MIVNNNLQTTNNNRALNTLNIYVIFFFTFFYLFFFTLIIIHFFWKKYLDAIDACMGKRENIIVWFSFFFLSSNLPFLFALFCLLYKKTASAQIKNNSTEEWMIFFCFSVEIIIIILIINKRRRIESSSNKKLQSLCLQNLIHNTSTYPTHLNWMFECKNIEEKNINPIEKHTFNSHLY